MVQLGPPGRIALTTQLKIPQVEKYDGKKSATGVRDWIRQVKNPLELDDHFRSNRAGATQVLSFVAAHVKGDALLWYDQIKLSAESGIPGAPRRCMNCLD